MGILSDFIYLDYCATTPVAPQVLEKMMPYFSESYGNASSVYHRMGRSAATAVDEARKQVAQLISAQEKEIVFTSGATEAINQVLQGVFLHYQGIGKHIITCQTEHPAVMDTCAFLQKQGAKITYLPVDAEGNLSLDDLQKAIQPDTMLISLMMANNETGGLHPIREIAQIAQQHHLLFFCDATQAVGKIPIDVQEIPVDLLALSAHKFYGPKGIGALYIRRKSRPIQVGALLHGGKQEYHLRAGTLNVPAIVGMGAAAKLAAQNLGQEALRLEALRKELEEGLLEIPESYLNSPRSLRLPHVSNIRFSYVKSAELMTAIPHIALSAGSACASGSREPSHVLTAMGLSKEDAECSIRFSLGIYTTPAQIQETIRAVRGAVESKRNASPLWKMHRAGML